MSIADKLLYLNETKTQLRQAINAAYGAGLTEADPFRSYLVPLWEHYILTTLFGNGEQGAWYDPSDLSTLFQDAAGTTPVTADGDPVGLMLDKSGNGNHATQAVAASRAVYRTDGTLHWLEFDGVDDAMFTQSVDLSPYTSMFVTAAATKLTDSKSGPIFLNGVAVTVANIQAVALLYPRSGTLIGAFFGRQAASGPSVAYEDSGQAAAPDTSVMTGVARPTTTLVRRNGMEKSVVTSTGGPLRNDTFRIGVTSSTYLRGNIYGLVVCAIDPADDVLGSVEAYLAYKAGVQL